MVCRFLRYVTPLQRSVSLTIHLLHILEDSDIQNLAGDLPLEFDVLALAHLQTLSLRDLHATILRLPAIERLLGAHACDKHRWQPPDPTSCGIWII